MSNILDSYVRAAPSPQNAVDIFAGEWSSIFPSSCGFVSNGTAPLFEDVRIAWLLERVGNLEGIDVLELGPLEGAHSYMLSKAGARSVVAIEGNSRAYLKCLIAKELLGMDRVRFQLGDFFQFLQRNERTFELGFASGVLYHMQNPAEVIALLARSCRELYVWTHYYDADLAAADPNVGRRFAPAERMEFQGFHHTVVKRAYGESLDWAGFCGGSAEYAYWMPREDLLECFRYFGYEILATAFEQRNHGNGAALALHVRRRDELPADFDEGLYLLANPDVAAAGANAKQHYQLYGHREGRKLRP